MTRDAISHSPLLFQCHHTFIGWSTLAPAPSRTCATPMFPFSAAINSGVAPSCMCQPTAIFGIHSVADCKVPKFYLHTVKQNTAYDGVLHHIFRRNYLRFQRFDDKFHEEISKSYFLFVDKIPISASIRF